MRPSGASRSELRLPALVAGASGFGRLHVRELVRLGYGPIGVSGRGAPSAAVTAEALGREFGTETIGHPDFVAGLSAFPAAVTICTPPETHLGLLHAAVRTNAYVFCEKPMFWDESCDARRAEAAARGMFAAYGGRLFVNHLNAILGCAYARTLERPPSTFRFAFATARQAEGRAIGVDLLPHAVSILLEILGEGAPSNIERHAGEDRFDVAFRWGETRCNFELRRRSGPSVLEIACDSRTARREQRAEGGRMDVALAFADGSRIGVPNPLEATFDRFDRALRTGSPLSEYDDASCRIVRWTYVLAGLE